MGDKNEPGGVALEVKADGAKVSVSDSALALIFPKRVARNRIDRAVANRIANKIEVGDYNFEPAERGFLSIVYEREIRRFEKQQLVLDQAEDVLPEVRALLTAGKEARHSDAGAPDDDWVERFLENAGKVSERRVRDLYARIAAGEVVQPGRFSMKTLSVVLDLDATAVTTWRKLRSLVFSDLLLIPYAGAASFYTARSISYDNLVHLESCGLLKLDSNHPEQVETRPDPETSLCRITYGDRVVRYRAEQPLDARLQASSLTPVGAQLISLHPFIHDDEYFQILLDYIGAPEAANLVETGRYRVDVEWTQDGRSWTRSGI
jgi:hypothetical protein